MNKDVLLQLVSDPNIDPTEWVGKALISWISKNARHCFQNKIARPYLLKAMEAHDAVSFSSTVCSVFQEEKDPSLIEDFIESCNSLYFNEWSINDIDRNLCRLLDTNHDLIDNLTKLKMGVCNAAYHIIPHLVTTQQVEQLLKNRKFRIPLNYWINMAELIPPEKLGRLFEEQFSKHLELGALDPTDTQSFLERLSMLLPKEDLPKWIKWVRNTNMHLIWRNRHCHSKKRSLDNVKLDKTVCRCGYLAANRSGLITHRKKCDSSKIPIYLLASILDAEHNRKPWCKKCGKVCLTETGLTLHNKNCKGMLKFEWIKNDENNLLTWFNSKSELYKSIAKHQQQAMEKKYVNKDENPVSGQTP